MTTCYAVLDTNIIISAMLKGASIPGIIVEYALNGPIIPLLNIEILFEYSDVLSRGKFHFNQNDIDDLITQLSRRAVFLDRTESKEIFPDPDDVVFYEVVLTAKKDTEAYLVTGNIKHFPVKPFVVTPRMMLDIIGDN